MKDRKRFKTLETKNHSSVQHAEVREASLVKSCIIEELIEC